MGLGSVIKGAVSSALPGLVSGGIGGLGGLASSWAANELFNKPAAETAFDRSMYGSAVAFNRSIDAYKQRYQWTMDDMFEAGLNPILAAGSGGFNISGQPQMKPPTAPLANVPQDYVSSSAQGFATARRSVKELELIKNKTDESLANAQRQRAQAGLFSKTEEKIVEDINRIKAEISLMATREDLNKEQKGYIAMQADKLVQQLVQLEKIANVYKTPTGTGLIWIQEVLRTLGIPLTAIGGIGLGRKIIPSLSPRILIEGKSKKFEPRW